MSLARTRSSLPVDDLAGLYEVLPGVRCQYFFRHGHAHIYVPLRFSNLHKLQLVQRIDIRLSRCHDDVGVSAFPYHGRSVLLPV